VNYYPQDFEQLAQQAHPLLDGEIAVAYAAEDEGRVTVVVESASRRDAAGAAEAAAAAVRAITAEFPVATDVVVIPTATYRGPPAARSGDRNAPHGCATGSCRCSHAGHGMPGERDVPPHRPSSDDPGGLAMSSSRAVLITGCSSRVGQATAKRFLRTRHPVYATARRLETLTGLAEAGAVTLALDVTDEESMVAAVKRVEDDHGAVGILVNNAAYGLQGAIEAVSVEQARTQFDTNLFGLIRLTQLVLAAMRAQGSGRIINVSAMGGHVTLPGTGILHASKHAVRAVSDALRMELRPFGVAVSTVEPGPIRTPFPEKANATLPPATGSGPYDRFHAELAARLDAAYDRKVKNLVLSADTVAHTIVRAARSAHPRARYPVGVMSRGVIALKVSAMPFFGGVHLWVSWHRGHLH
jgi:short-subunit dehydrogenase